MFFFCPNTGLPFPSLKIPRLSTVLVRDFSRPKVDKPPGPILQKTPCARLTVRNLHFRRQHKILFFRVFFFGELETNDSELPASLFRFRLYPDFAFLFPFVSCYPPPTVAHCLDNGPYTSQLPHLKFSVPGSPVCPCFLAVSNAAISLG